MEEQNHKTVTVAGDGFTRFTANLSKFVDPLGKYVGAIFGGLALAIMMFLTIADILGRFLGDFKAIDSFAGFIGPVSGSYEMTELLMGILVTFGLGYTALHKGHIRVDLIMQYTSKKVNLWFDIFAYGLAFLFACGIAWQSWIQGLSIHESQLTTANLHIPIYPFPFILLFGAAILALVMLRDLFVAIEEVRK